jgi:uncharacterized protein YbjT (DUF2867 family)
MQSTKGETMTRPTLVLGGTGKTGRRVVERLRARDLPVRVGSRSATPPFDWEDPATWAPALDGVGSVYVSYAPDLAMPGADETLGAFARLAVDSGVPRLELISGRGEPEAEAAEDKVRASGADLTVIRCAFFAQNFSEYFLLDGILEGVVALPAGRTPEPFVDADDIADVAVAALTDRRHIGQTYELTGPRALSFAEAVDVIAKVSGREIQYLPITIDDYAAAAAAEGVPNEIVELLAYLFGSVLDGRNVHITDGVQRALGRPPRSFEQYARDAAASGVFNQRGEVAV